MPQPEIPTWEASKEIADKLPGKDPGKDDQCPTCGNPLDQDQDPKQKGY